MNTLVVYDSNFGNTKLIAEQIAQVCQTNAAGVDEVTAAMVAAADVLVVGSPINGWRPTVKITEWLKSLPSGSLAGKQAAAFDTRVKLFIHGNAAIMMANELKRAGANITVDPEGFIVSGKAGPLAAGELERAAQWAESFRA